MEVAYYLLTAPLKNIGQLFHIIYMFNHFMNMVTSFFLIKPELFKLELFQVKP